MRSTTSVASSETPADAVLSLERRAVPMPSPGHRAPTSSRAQRGHDLSPRGRAIRSPDHHEWRRGNGSARRRCHRGSAGAGRPDREGARARCSDPHRRRPPSGRRARGRHVPLSVEWSRRPAMACRARYRRDLSGSGGVSLPVATATLAVVVGRACADGGCGWGRGVGRWAGW